MNNMFARVLAHLNKRRFLRSWSSMVAVLLVLRLAQSTSVWAQMSLSCNAQAESA